MTEEELEVQTALNLDDSTVLCDEDTVIENVEEAETDGNEN